MPFPQDRLRRLRATAGFRRMVRETRLSVDNLIAPFLVVEGRDVRLPMVSMPGQWRVSVDHLIKDAGEVHALGVPAILLFGIPARKDEIGSEAWAPNGIVPRAVRAVKGAIPEVMGITDVCVEEYTTHGHCGIVKDGQVVNDETLACLQKMALSHARAGADMVAPADMMDGRVGAIRQALDGEGFSQVPILAYAAKFASCLYAPFREAADSSPKFGDRQSYQMDPANLREALREIELDIQEGADIVMIKPALPYLDVVHAARQAFNRPIAAYQVSGEYSMIKAAAQLGWLDERRAMLETVLALLEEAGVDVVVRLPFTREFAAQTPDEFMVQVLRDGLGTRELFVGQNFRFGKERLGTIQSLTAAGPRLGFTVHAIAPVVLEGAPVSSTRIRDLVQAGAMAEAAILLGRPYTLRGTVIHGNRRGGELGYPTANLLPRDGRVLPPDRVYAPQLKMDMQTWGPVTDI